MDEQCAVARNVARGLVDAKNLGGGVVLDDEAVGEVERHGDVGGASRGGECEEQKRKLKAGVEAGHRVSSVPLKAPQAPRPRRHAPQRG